MKRHVRWLTLAVVLALAAYLRLVNVGAIPGIYTDEGTHLDIAFNLLDGQIRYLAISQSTLLFAKLPLFDLLLALLLRLFGGGIITLRTLSGVLGVLTVLLMYVVIDNLQNDPYLPLLAALVLAVFPDAVLYSRFGFSYNLLCPLVLMALWGLVKYARSENTRWLILAAGCIGIGAMSDLIMLSFSLPMILVILTQRRRDILLALLLIALPLAIYAGVMLIIVSGAFLFDLSYTLTRVGRQTLWAQITTLALNIVTLLSNVWLTLGLVGLVTLRERTLRGLSLLLLLPVLVVGRSVALHGLSFYYMIPFLPLLALGMAALIRAGIPLIAELISESTQRLVQHRLTMFVCMVLASVAAALPFVMFTLLTIQNVRHGWTTNIDPFLVSIADAKAVADYVNAQTQPGDVVIASPAVAWLIDADTADFQMVAAYDGQATPHLPGDVPTDRWTFEAGIEAADYVIIDNLWRNWAALHIPLAFDVMVLADEDWELLFSSGEVAVYEVH